jgi:hypothetical protein
MISTKNSPFSCVGFEVYSRYFDSETLRIDVDFNAEDLIGIGRLIKLRYF